MNVAPYLTDVRIAQIEALLSRATPGPWAFKDRLGGGGCFVFSEETFHVVAVDEDGAPSITVPLGREDAAFIAGAREDVPLLLAEVRRLRAHSPGDPGLRRRLVAALHPLLASGAGAAELADAVIEALNPAEEPVAA